MKNDEKSRISTLKIFILAIALLGLTGGGPAKVWSADAVTVTDDSTTVTVVDVTTADDPQPSESYYANPAQAAHAAQLAEQSAMSDQPVQDAFQAVAAAQTDVDAAQAELDTLQTGTPTVEEIAATEQKLAAEELNLASMEKVYTDAVAEGTGVVASDILAMRTSGMGWGEIAHELGVHPSALGLGHDKATKSQFNETATATGITGIEPDELAEATARDTRNGLSKGRGLNAYSGIHEPGTGLTPTDATPSSKSMAGQDTGVNSGEKGNAGGGNANGNDAGNSDSSGNSNSGDNSDKGAGNGNDNGGSNSGGNGNAGGNSGGNDNGGGNSGGNGNGGGKK